MPDVTRRRRVAARRARSCYRPSDRGMLTIWKGDVVRSRTPTQGIAFAIITGRSIEEAAMIPARRRDSLFVIGCYR